MTRLYRSLLSAAAALAMGAAMVSAHAQPQDRGNQNNKHNQNNQRPNAQRPHGPPSQAQRPGPPSYRPGERPSYGPGHGPGARPPAYRPGQRPPQFQGGPGAGPQHNWYPGTRIPPSYRTRHYVVNDWRGHHLWAPPRGYYWVQYGADYVLVAIPTGIAVQIVLGR